MTIGHRVGRKTSSRCTLTGTRVHAGKALARAASAWPQCGDRRTFARAASTAGAKIAETIRAKARKIRRVRAGIHSATGQIRPSVATGSEVASRPKLLPIASRQLGTRDATLGMNLRSCARLNAPAASARHVNDVRSLVAGTERSTGRTIERLRLRSLDCGRRSCLWLKATARKSAAAAPSATTTAPHAAATPGEIGGAKRRDQCERCTSAKPQAECHHRHLRFDYWIDTSTLAAGGWRTTRLVIDGSVTPPRTR